MTEFRELEIRIISAEDVKNVKLLGKMESYVVAYVDPALKSSTHVAKKGGKNPVWNEKLNLWVPEHMLHQPNGVLMLEIYSPGSLGNEMIGFVQIPLSSILGLPNASTEFVNMSYQVRRPSGRSQGMLNFSVRLGNKTTRENSRGPQEPVMAYPAAPYPQYQQPGGYYPQQYPPQQQFVTEPQRPPRNGRLGGAGLGLGAGLLGGLLLGDLIGSSYHYGGGFGGGGFGGPGFGGGGFGGPGFGGGDFGGGGFDGGGFGGGDFGGGF